MKPSKCINCKERPIIVKTEDDVYPFVLRHPDGACCHPMFRLEAYHYTKKECIAMWEEFNTREDLKKREGH